MSRMTLTESVRARFYKVTGSCPTCHGPGMSIRAVAKASGCDQGAVFRFRNGKSVSSDNLDKLAAWIERQEEKA